MERVNAVTMPSQNCEEDLEFLNESMLTKIIAPALECPPQIWIRLCIGVYGRPIGKNNLVLYQWCFIQL